MSCFLLFQHGFGKPFIDIYSLWRHHSLHVVFITLEFRSVGLGLSVPPFQNRNGPFSMTTHFSCTSANCVMSYVKSYS